MRTGTVISGTMRPEDLIPAFIDAIDAAKEDLSFRGPVDNLVQDINRMDGVLGEIERRMEGDSDYFESEEASWDLETLFDLLDELAPEGFRFGAHEGDGADYGYWEVEED
jgi:hypothetical protein